MYILKALDFFSFILSFFLQGLYCVELSCWCKAVYGLYGRRGYLWNSISDVLNEIRKQRVEQSSVNNAYIITEEQLR